MSAYLGFEVLKTTRSGTNLLSEGLVLLTGGCIDELIGLTIEDRLSSMAIGYHILQSFVCVGLLKLRLRALRRLNYWYLLSNPIGLHFNRPLLRLLPVV